jgi:hypothetical protein
MSNSSEVFSVCQWFMDGSYDYEVKYVSSEEAVRVAINLARSVGARIGTTTRVIIVDGGDCTCWEWQYPVGVTFPEATRGDLSVTSKPKLVVTKEPA